MKDAVPILQRGDIRAVSDFFQSSGNLMGVPAKFNQFRYMPLTDGRWINDSDDSQKRAVVVWEMNPAVVVPGRPSIGSTILLNGTRFQVIGTLKRIGHGDNNGMNLRIFIPFNTMQQLFSANQRGNPGRDFVHQLPAAARELHMSRRRKCTR